MDGWPGSYECDGPTMEAPSGSYWNCTPGNSSYDAHIAEKVEQFQNWAAAEPKIAAMNPWVSTCIPLLLRWQSTAWPLPV